jgi:hypothetical protein
MEVTLAEAAVGVNAAGLGMPAKKKPPGRAAKTKTAPKARLPSRRAALPGRAAAQPWRAL